jgi:hypothetical protein
LVAVLAAPRTAASQPATAQAEHLFREGKRLIAEGNITAACEAFEGSYGKDPAISTLLNLADCREKNQQYASAWAHFVEAARQATRDSSQATLAKSAADRAAAVEKRLSYLIINVPDESRVQGLAITRNGVAVEAVEWNRDIPVDGGTYVIEGKAPAYESWSTKITVGNAKDKQSVNVPRFSQVLGGPGTEQLVQDTRPAGGFTGKRKAAVALWLIGAGALGVGVGFEFKSRGTYDDAKIATTNDERHVLTDSATRERQIGVAVASLGAVALGTGVYFWVTGRQAERQVSVVPHVGGRDAGLAIVGSF